MSNMSGRTFSMMPDLTPVIRKLILANCVIFFLMLFPGIRNWASTYAALWPNEVTSHVWQLGSYMFLHSGFSHLFWNMFMLFMFGSDVEKIFSSKKFFQYYIACGLGAAAVACMFYRNVTVLLPGSTEEIIVPIYIMGSSGAVYGVALAFALLFPYRTLLVFGVFPIQARFLAAIFVLGDLANGIQGNTSTAHFAHLGGMATGAVLFFVSGKIKIRTPIFILRWQEKSRQREAKKVQEQSEIREEQIDQILDKISKEGMGNLTKKERAILKQGSTQIKSGKK